MVFKSTSVTSTYQWTLGFRTKTKERLLLFTYVEWSDRNTIISIISKMRNLRKKNYFYDFIFHLN